MSRTYRRRRQRHDYDWVLRDFRWLKGALVPFLTDPRSKKADARLRAFTPMHAARCAALRRAGTDASSIIAFAH